MDALSLADISSFLQVVLIDLSLAGDNALVIGMAAAALPQEERRKAIFWGIIGATVLRVLFSCGAALFMRQPGLVMLGGGLLLFWVSWKLYRQIKSQKTESVETHPHKVVQNLRAAIMQIIFADVSMSLDNVLAVAGAARENLWVLGSGLVLSVVLMGSLATAIERLLHRFPVLAYIGLAIIVYVAASMTYDGAIALL